MKYVKIKLLMAYTGVKTRLPVENISKNGPPELLQMKNRDIKIKNSIEWLRHYYRENQ